VALIGYARVSTEGQDLEPQRRALREAGCTALVEERASGADRARPELARLLGRLRPGDTVVVVRIDRLARSLAHLLGVLEQVGAAGARFRSLSDPIDTGSPTGRLVLQVIGAIAEFERSLIAERTRAGLAVARARGKRLGNPALRAGEPEAVRRLVAGQRRARLEALAANLDDWLPVVRRLRPAEPWERVTAAVNAALPAGRPPFTRDRLVRAMRLLAAEGLAEPALLAPGRGQGRPPERASARAAEAVARYLRGHRREAAERGVALRDYRPPTLAQVARHLVEDAGLRPPSGGAWAPSSVKALVQRAEGLGLTRPRRTSGVDVL
jgi:DNA invertase Pin-like site-specific DNA recombinase